MVQALRMAEQYGTRTSVSFIHIITLSCAKHETAVPPPPPKQFTDEELKQQYGIHLATRLQSDDATEQKSKWADIDEDEDDWAPETVEWMDGTKTTISHTDAIVPPPTEKPLDKPQEEQQPMAPVSVPSAKPAMTALKRPGSTTQSRTILRPGAAQQAKQIGADGKATPDDKSPMLKNIAPAPIKSPWAQLPPVEKVSPVVVNPPPVTQIPLRFTSRDPHGFDAMVSQQPPAREIAADTFDRSWKEGERSNRELFNSQSGRYEPAPELRRGSRQHDHFHRQPSVLQRPSQQNGPAEPSAAFQARTNSQTDGSPWARRRGSSFSGNMLRDRRMSSSSKVFDASEPSPEIVPEHNAGVQQAAESPDAQIHQTDGAAPSALSIAEERERQKKLMQEKREAAIRRRQEEEAREEAERRERIRKKMEALGMPLEKTPSQDKAEKTQLEAQKPTVDAEATEMPKLPAEDIATAAPVAGVPAAEAAERQSHVETHVSPVKQSSPTRKEQTGDPSLSFAQSASSITRAAPKSLSSPQLPGLHQHSPNAPSRSPYPQSSLQGVTASSFSSPGEQKAQPARLPSISSGDSFTTTPWGSGITSSHTATNSSVWGPPTNNRHIGNGTFDTGYSSISPGSRQQSQATPFAAPFTRPYTSRVSPTAFGQATSAQSANLDHQYTSLSNMDSQISEPTAVSALAGASPLPEPARPAYISPIAPPQKAAARPPPARDMSAWTNFVNNAQAREDEQAAQWAAHRAKAQGPSSPPRQQWTEVFRQTKPGDSRWLSSGRTGAGKQVISRGAAPSHNSAAVDQIISTPQSPNAPFSMNQQPPPGVEQLHMPGEGVVRLPTAPSAPKSFANPGNAVRLPPLAAYAGNVQPLPTQTVTSASTPQQSRFFPSALYGGSPPPEETDHPVHGGNFRHPQVNLPAPKPKVRLPPVISADHSQSSPVTMPHSVHSFTVGARPLVQTSDWQARFNGLFGRAQIRATVPPSPPKTPPKAQTPASAVTPVSRVSSDTVVTQSTTLVSLPPSSSPSSSVTKIVSKPGVDDIFDGELSFGSTPRVFLPRGITYPDSSGNGPTTSKSHTKPSKPVQSQSKRMLFVPDNTSHDIAVRIRLPQPWSIAKEVMLPRKNKGYQGLKNSRSSNKNKRNAPSNTINDATVSTPVSENPAGAADKVAKASQVDKTAASNPDAEDNNSTGRKKNVWVKAPKAPRGRGAGYKSRA